jgi:hypothetical protein
MKEASHKKTRLILVKETVMLQLPSFSSRIGPLSSPLKKMFSLKKEI